MLKKSFIAITILCCIFLLFGCSKDKELEQEETYQIYKLAQTSGYEGTYEEWLKSIKGEKGDKGDTGAQGKSAYEIFKENYPDYQGTEKDWITDIALGNKCNLFGHDYIKTIIEVTCLEDGYTLYKCSVCGNEYHDDIVNCNGHVYELIEHKDYMGSTDGYDRYRCKKCYDTYDIVIESPIHKVSIWDGKTTTKPENLVQIDGIYYYEINSAEELAYIQSETNTRNNYILNTDILLNESELLYDTNGSLTIDSSSLNVWTGFRCQRFEGNGYKISGLFSKNSGLIIYCDIVSNLSVVNAYVSTTSIDTIGGIVNSAGKVKNCFFEGAVKGYGSYDRSYPTWAEKFVGGVAGRSTEIYNCISKGLIIGNYGVGGVCGKSETATDCINYAEIYGQIDHVGGICGFNDWWSGIRNCINYGNVFGQKNVGGIAGTVIGNSDAGCYQSKNFGQVTGDENVGGICGWNATGKIDSCINDANVYGKSAVGGICGYNSEEIIKNINYGNVIGESVVGAVVGFADIMSDDLKIQNNKYLKNESVNYMLFGIGNLENNDGCQLLSTKDSKD